MVARSMDRSTSGKKGWHARIRGAIHFLSGVMEFGQRALHASYFRMDAWKGACGGQAAPPLWPITTRIPRGRRRRSGAALMHAVVGHPPLACAGPLLLLTSLGVSRDLLLEELVLGQVAVREVELDLSGGDGAGSPQMRLQAKNTSLKQYARLLRQCDPTAPSSTMTAHTPA